MAGLAIAVSVLPDVSSGQSRPASGASVRIVRIDGTQQEGEWLGADGDAIRIGIDATSVRFPRDDLMLIAFVGGASSSRPAAETSKHVLCTLANGSSIRGELAKGDEGSLRLRTPLLGDLTLQFTDLAAVRLGSVGESPKAQAEFDKWLSNRPAGNDVLIAVPDGAVTAVRGALVAIGPEGGKFSFSGRTLPLRPDVTYAVVFGAGLAPQPAAPFTVSLRDGSAVTAAITGADSRALSLQMAGQIPVSVPIDQVERIAVRSPRVTLASDLAPSEVKFEPFLDTPWPHRRDRAVSNRPMRLGGIEYLKGLGVHSRSEIAFELDAKYKQFAATIGIDDHVRPRGNVVFRVLADDREVFNSGPVTGKDEPRPILADISKAKRVRLVVEFGEELDLADHADWANARFIR